MFDFNATDPINYKPSRTSSIMQNLTLETYQRAWLTQIKPNVLISANGCFLHQYKPNKDQGYCQIAINNRKYCAHIISYILWHRVYSSDLYVSHRCGKSNCCNPEHLVLESNQINESRKHCIEFGSFTTCCHDPKCIGHTVV
jgi:hypothetical protein